MKVYEVASCSEYAWDCSHGLFATEQAALRSIPQHTVEVWRGDDAVIVALPEYSGMVKGARSADRCGYWWYHLPMHGETEDGEPMFYAIFARDVQE